MGCGTSHVSAEEIKDIQQKSGFQISEKDIQHWHRIWVKIAPMGKMSSDQFVKFIVENKIGTGRAHDALNMFKMMDKDKNGVMEFQEFVLILVLPRSTEEVTTEQFATLCMSIYDEDNDGHITKEELLKFALAKAKAEGREEYKAQIVEVVEKIVKYIDTNADGKLTKEELVQAINKDPYLKKVL